MRHNVTRPFLAGLIACIFAAPATISAGTISVVDPGSEQLTLAIGSGSVEGIDIRNGAQVAVSNPAPLGLVNILDFSPPPFGNSTQFAANGTLTELALINYDFANIQFSGANILVPATVTPFGPPISDPALAGLLGSPKFTFTFAQGVLGPVVTGQPAGTISWVYTLTGVSTVPEPGTWCMGTAALGALVLLRRRRR